MTSKASPLPYVKIVINLTEDILPILRLPVLKHFPTLLATVLETESWIWSVLQYLLRYKGR